MRKTMVITGLCFMLLLTGWSCTNKNNSNSTPPAPQEEFCQIQGSNTKMSYTDAKNIASTSQCNQGSLKETHFCNENSGTWWIDLDIKKDGCNPACVINVETKLAEINWRCTGLTQP